MELINEEIQRHCVEFASKMADVFKPGNNESIISMTTKQIIDAFEQDFDYRPDSSTLKSALEEYGFISIPFCFDGLMSIKYFFDEK